MGRFQRVWNPYRGPRDAEEAVEVFEQDSVAVQDGPGILEEKKMWQGSLSML